MMPNNKKGTLGVKKLRALLTPRDQLILDSVAAHKFLTTKQIYTLHFWNHASYVSGIRACTRVLNRLHDHHLIYRLERPVGGFQGGSSSYVWGLDAAGDRLMRSTPENQNKRARAFEPSTMFLAHTLAVADARIRLEEMARAGAIELVGVTTEPQNWRPFGGTSGTPQVLKPDLHAVTASGEFEDWWFMEIDRGTEALPTLLRKCHYYRRYQASGLEQDAHGVFPLVLWIMPHEARRQRLEEAIQTERGLEPRLFKIITPDQLTAVIAGEVIDTNQPKGGTS